MRAVRLIWSAFLLAGAAGPAGAEPGRSDSPIVAKALASAADVQREVLRSLAQILREQKVTLSDGALLSALEELLADVKKQREGIMELGRETLGKTQGQLTPAQRQQLDRLVQNQRMYANRYRRFQGAIERKALGRPDSAFASILSQAAEAQLLERFDGAAELLAANQLARAVPQVDRIIQVLEQLLNMMAGALGEGPTSRQGEPGFTMPSLVITDRAMRIPQFPWSGDVVDALGEIMRAVRRLEELARRQREIAAQVEKLAGTSQPQKKLGAQEFEIRFYVLYIAERIGILDPLVDRELHAAGDVLKQSGEALQDGRTAEAAEPANEAAERLTRAAVALRKAWEDILERLAQYTAEAELAMSSSIGIPHGMSKAALERLRRKIMKLLRATGALTAAITRQTKLKGDTIAARDEPKPQAGPQLARPQDELDQFIATEVIPHNVAPDEQTAKMGGPAVIQGEDKAGALLDDSRGAMQRAAKGLRSEQLAEAVVEQTEALDCMGDALRIMIVILQKLLGQYAPPGMAMGQQAQMGLASKVGKLPRIGAGWAWNLPPRKREEVRQAFRGSFPARYDRLIKLYYMNIAREQPNR